MCTVNVLLRYNVETKVYNFPNFSLSREFCGKKINFPENHGILGLQNVLQRWQNVTQFCLKNLLNTIKSLHL